jgi:hypothetical protein
MVFKCFMWMVLESRCRGLWILDTQSTVPLQTFCSIHTVLIYSHNFFFLCWLVCFGLKIPIVFHHCHYYLHSYLCSLSISLLSIVQYYCVLITIIFILVSVHSDIELLYQGMRVALSRRLREQEFPHTLCTWKRLWKLSPECYGFYIWTRTMDKVQINSFKHYPL